MNDERVRIGARIRELRESAGMTQNQLAEKSRLLASNIDRIEKGKYSPDLDILSCIAAVFGKKVDFI
ncbi:MAG: helix-turn-helix transcriptional regulator [Chitinophagaceae bacterium]|nr:helix-turn-helix transcriptional regulator [Chitinophagaceae bacterium]